MTLFPNQGNFFFYGSNLVKLKWDIIRKRNMTLKITIESKFNSNEF
jgi:hypothetical protein